MKRLTLACLARVLAEPDSDPVAVLRGDIDQQSFDVARVGSRPHHVQKPVAAVLFTPEFDADCPIGVIELGFFSGGEIPIADDIEVGRDRVNDGTPFPLEIQPGGGPDLPVAAQQPLALANYSGLATMSGRSESQQLAIASARHHNTETSAGSHAGCEVAQSRVDR
jgi:hypothetical protein